MENAVKVLGIPLYNQNIPRAVAELIRICKEEKPQNRLVSATGAHGLVYAQENENFAKILQNFYWNLPDGMPGVWIGRWKGAKQMQRCYGPGFFAETMQKTASTPIKHFFCGGKEGVAEELKEKCGKKFGNYNIVGTFCPPFREMTDEEMRELGHKIQESGAEVVWIGLSTPKQELFATRLAKFVECHFIITVGAAFDFHTDKVKQAPRWVQNIGMEWFFRLLMEPKRLYKRYLHIVPKFIYLNFLEFLKLRKV
ncbi:WecB/TagA/CpsF family glycosyltransferase [Raineya orbicola]|uniref:Glycosyltransferase, WecB/TagA/CpsF family n=1 Tax=Raineya orbicola TaxID=2016530 RepID=A0A2N3IC51_9BACT|nr:WecB/TagA/CpsF family glycosyltransferase [Raineya orbicola]PKQ67855.1 Glycosyltransferase, WecB/TagA/CpsF family [Raineya orbicola]